MGVINGGLLLKGDCSQCGVFTCASRFLFELGMDAMRFSCLSLCLVLVFVPGTPPPTVPPWIITFGLDFNRGFMFKGAKHFLVACTNSTAFESS